MSSDMSAPEQEQRLRRICGKPDGCVNKSCVQCYVSFAQRIKRNRPDAYNQWGPSALFHNLLQAKPSAERHLYALQAPGVQNHRIQRNVCVK